MDRNRPTFEARVKSMREFLRLKPIKLTNVIPFTIESDCIMHLLCEGIAKAEVQGIIIPESRWSHRMAIIDDNQVSEGRTTVISLK